MFPVNIKELTIDYHKETRLQRAIRREPSAHIGENKSETERKFESYKEHTINILIFKIKKMP